MGRRVIALSLALGADSPASFLAACIRMGKYGEFGVGVADGVIV
jgi:hypothetical protein